MQVNFMKQKINLWQLMGFAVTSLLGTILHFLYDWLNGAYLIAPFSGVNESTWEHMKLLFWPMLIFSIVQSFFFKEREDFWCIKLKGIALGLVLIPTIFYTYIGIIGRSYDFINITIFFVAALASYAYESRVLKSKSQSCKYSKLFLLILILVGILFIIFTFNTPKIGLFMDPVSGLYGISG